MDVSRLVAIFEANTTNFDSGVKRVQGGLKDTEGRAQSAGNSVSSFWKTFSGNFVAQAALSAVTKSFQALANVVEDSISRAASFDSLKRGLISVVGDASKAEEQLKRLRDVARAPGLGFREAIQGSINLQAAGFNAQLAERALKGFGNALAAVGKGKSDLEGVITALSQIQSKGKISAEEIGQLAERLPQIRQLMKDAFGTADTQVLQNRNIGATEFVEKITQSLEKLPQVTGGAQNAFENLSDAYDIALTTFATPLLEPLSNALNAITPTLETIGTKLGQFSQGVIDTFRSAWSELPDTTRAAFTDMLTPITDFFTRIEEFLTKNGTTYKDAVKNMLTNIATEWQRNGSQIKGFIEGWHDVILTLNESFLKFLAGDTKGGFDKLVEAMEKTKPTMQKAVDLVVGVIISTLENSKDSMYKIGMALGDGIASGIKQSIINKLSGITGTIANAVTVEPSSGINTDFQKDVTLKAHASRKIKAITDGITEAMPQLQSVLKTVEDTLTKILTKKPEHGKLFDFMAVAREGAESLKDRLNELTNILRGEQTELQKLNDLFKDPGVKAALDYMSDKEREITTYILRRKAALIDNLNLAQQWQQMMSNFEPNIPAPSLSGITTKETNGNFVTPDVAPKWILSAMDIFKIKWADFKASIPSFSNLLQDAFFQGVNGAGNILATGLTQIRGNFKDFFKGIGLDFANLMRDIAASILKALAVQGILKVLSFLIPSGGSTGSGMAAVGGIGIPGFAEGGVTSGGIARVGERGAEYAFFPRGTRVVSHEDSMSALSGKGAGNTYITNNVNVSSKGTMRMTASKSRRQLADDMLSAMLRSQRS